MIYLSFSMLGICKAPAPAPAPAPEQTCLEFFPDTCNDSKSKTCHEKCFRQLKGHGTCMKDSVCWCRYPCGPANRLRSRRRVLHLIGHYPVPGMLSFLSHSSILVRLCMKSIQYSTDSVMCQML